MGISNFIERGVVIPCPTSVEIDEAIPPERIAPGVIIHAGSKILGTETSIGPGCRIGNEAPATIENCQLGRKVLLGGGYFSGATFLDKSSMGSGAHVRSGTLIEEEAGGAHTVGFKQTIFFPFVIAGSLINFCDCLMAGGTGRKNHSEIGSSYIHFNFTPNQDKATPSLIGDVPRGVLLDQLPIFLGGQGGLVGPARIAYGTVIPAGAICRQDVLPENQLFVPPALDSSKQRTNVPGLYRSIDRIVVNNLHFLGNLFALKAWYRLARRKFMTDDVYEQACWVGALGRIESCIVERTKRLKELAGKLPHSLELAGKEKQFPADFRRQQENLARIWPEIESRIAQGAPDNAGAAERDQFLAEWHAVNSQISYLEAVARLTAPARSAATAWLQAQVEFALSLWPAAK
jgi:hypothetical protein